MRKITNHKLSLRGDRVVQRSGRLRFEIFVLAGAVAATSCTPAVPQPIGSTRVITPAAAADSVATSVDYRRIEREVVVELNAARRDPAGYSTYLAELIPMFDGDVLRRPNHPVGVRTTEGAAAVREAVGALRAQAPEPPLSFAEGLAAAARELAVDEGRTGAVGHTGSDGSTPATRITRHGAWGVSYAQTLVVFSEGHLTERLYLFARSAILFDRSVEPVPTSRRVITIFPDERLRLDADGATKWTVLRASFAAVGNSFANAVAASRSKAKTIHVDGLGPVTLLHDANFEAP